MLKIGLFGFFILLLFSCSRAPLKNVKDSLRLTSTAPKLIDSLSRESFFVALKKHIEVMKKSKQVLDPMTFGDRKIKKADYLMSLEKIFEHEADWLSWINSNFDFYEVYGNENWSEVMSTGYYEPKVQGSKEETEKFSQAVYYTPNDLVTVNLKKFASKFPVGENLGILRGRLENNVVIPYYDRKDIDELKKLKDQKQEIAWIRAIDAFFIQIQGSGVIEFEDGETLRIGYDSQNGHPYVPIGKFLTDVIPMESMSMQKIRSHLETLSRAEQQSILNKNPSYVFFKKLDGQALTYAGMEVQAGRTIATDTYFFPKGAIAFLDIEEPIFASPDDIEATSWVRAPRIVFDQDTGGAIRGGGRVDLYFGQGESAAQKAGVMKRNGKLYYLVPRLE